jgi:hypothetical protein
MDAKITLSFDRVTIKKAKEFAESQQTSLSRHTGYLYRQITRGTYKSLDEFPPCRDFPECECAGCQVIVTGTRP